MRIVCDNCAAKYQISDEKVRNKVFKIRCKRCAHVIVVRANEQGERAEAPVQAAVAPVEAEPAVAQAAAGAVWYVVVNREQVGPLTPDQVLAHFERGDVDADTFTWAEGMADWVRLATIPEFADHVAAAAPAPADPAPTQQVATDQSASDQGATAAVAAPAAQASASLFDDGGDDDDVIASNNQSEGLFGDSNDDGFEGGGPRVSSSQQLRNQRNENSVLFSLDSLSADPEPARAVGMVTSTGGSDASGLIDISALGAGGALGAPVAAADLDDAFGGATGGAAVFAPVAASPAGPMPTYVTRPTSGGGKIAIYAVLALLVLGGGGFAAWYFTREAGPEGGQTPASVAAANAASAASGPSTVAIGTPATAAPVPGVAPATSAGSVASAAAPDTGAAAPESLAVAPKATRSARKTPARRRTARTSARPKAPAKKPSASPRTSAPRRAAKPAKPSKSASEVDNLLDGLGGGGKPAGGKPAQRQPAAAAGGDPTLPDKLSKSQILRVVRTNASKISGCKSRDPGASGTIKVVMIIGKSGRVNSAKAGGPFAGTPVGSCVEGKVKGFRFPQFGGDDMRINMPFRL
ncbi:MAG: putative Zn finger-like uncharacterized protein [Bradymonadia bacterium]|jgi:predicted Zn finger-like uncharacterized protein